MYVSQPSLTELHINLSWIVIHFKILKRYTSECLLCFIIIKHEMTRSNTKLHDKKSLI